MVTLLETDGPIKIGTASERTLMTFPKSSSRREADM